MSAFGMKCLRCGGEFIGGVVGSTPWPAHVCPDGARNAPTEGSDWMTRGLLVGTHPRTGDATSALHD